MLPKPKGNVVAPVNVNVNVNVALCLLIINLFTRSAKTQDPTFLYSYCPNTSTFSPGSIYQKNLNHLLSDLSSNATRPNGFYNATAGTPATELVYGLFLCRGDVIPTTCQQCVNAATKRLHDECPVQKESIIWYDECLLRYSNVSIFSAAATSPSISLFNTANVSEPTRFMQVLGNITRSLVQKVAHGGSDKKFGTRKVNFSPFEDIYTLAQCTPDLSVLDCSRCLEIAVAGLPSCCDGKKGGRVIFPSCYVRYELYIFYNPPARPLRPPPAANTQV